MLLMIGGGLYCEVCDEDYDVQAAIYHACQEAARKVAKRGVRGGADKDRAGDPAWWMIRPEKAISSQSLYEVEEHISRQEFAARARDHAESEGHKEPLDWNMGYVNNFVRGPLGASSLGGDAVPSCSVAVPEVLRRREKSNQCFRLHLPDLLKSGSSELDEKCKYSSEEVETLTEELKCLFPEPRFLSFPTDVLDKSAMKLTGNPDRVVALACCQIECCVLGGHKPGTTANRNEIGCTFFVRCRLCGGLHEVWFSMKQGELLREYSYTSQDDRLAGEEYVDNRQVIRKGKLQETTVEDL